jgi:hypothetical protein
VRDVDVTRAGRPERAPGATATFALSSDASANPTSDSPSPLTFANEWNAPPG